MTLKLITRGMLLLIIFKVISPAKPPVIDPYIANHFKKNTITNISINTAQPGVKIPSNFLGFSYEITALLDTVYFKSSHTKFKNLLDGLGSGIIRLGGYYVNNHYWTNRPRTALTGPDSIATSDMDSMINFMRQTNWKVILNLNLANSTPAINTSEAKYAWLNGRDVITAFEYGNEPEAIWNVKDYDKYKAVFVANYNHVKSNLGNVPICGPASLYPMFFVDKFTRDGKNKVNFITTHLYSVGEANKPHSVYELLDDKYLKKVHDFSKQVDSIVSKENLTYRIDECNNYGDEGTNVADRFTAALWGIDFMFTAAQNNCQGINFHGGSRGFTPILIRKGFAMKPQALYYGMLFFHLASQGKLLPVKIDHTGIKSYAVVQPDNKIAITVINKDPAVNATVNITLNKRFTKANMMLLESPSIYSKDSITLGKASISGTGKWKPAYKNNLTFRNGALLVTIPKATAALITVSN
jgi:hypothetical protein